MQSFPGKIALNVGNKFRLVCSVERGIGPFEFDWFRDDRKISSSSSLISPDSIVPFDNRDDNLSVEFGDDYTQLIIKRISWLHRGNYTCNVRNSFGFDRLSIAVIVKGVRH